MASASTQDALDKWDASCNGIEDLINSDGQGAPVARRVESVVAQLRLARALIAVRSIVFTPSTGRHGQPHPLPPAIIEL